MKNQVWRKYVKLPIKSLSLWDENPRFPEEYFKKSEKELIDFLLDNVRFKIKDFAKEIINDFDLPQFEEILVLNNNDRNIVIEGNRRLAVYKLLNDPSLANTEELRIFFLKLKHKVQIDKEYILTAHVTQDKEAGLRFVDRKHNKNNNQIEWGEIERSHFAVRRNKGFNKDVFKVEFTKRIKTLDLPANVISDVLGKGYVTTLFRIIDNPPAREKLEYSVKENGEISIENDRVFSNILKTIIYNVWTKEGFAPNRYVDSRSLNTVDEIKKYLTELSADDTLKVDKAINENKSKNLLGEDIILRPKNVKDKKEISIGIDGIIKKKEFNKEMTVFVIMPFDGLDDVYQAIDQTAKAQYKHVKVYKINDSSGAKTTQDEKIESALETCDFLVAVLSMGDKEKMVYEALKKDKNPNNILEKFYPINHNVLVELGYGLKAIKLRGGQKDIFILVSDKKDGELPTLKEFSENKFFDIRNRSQISYSDIPELKNKLDKAFKNSDGIKRFK